MNFSSTTSTRTLFLEQPVVFLKASFLQNCCRNLQLIEEYNELGFFNLSSPELFKELKISCLNHAPTLCTSVLCKATLLMLIAVFTIVSNGWMMINIQKKQRQRSSHLYTGLWEAVIILCKELYI